MALAPLRARGARVVVADGGSADDTLARARRFDGVEVMITEDPATRSVTELAALSRTYELPILSVHAPVLPLSNTCPRA